MQKTLRSSPSYVEPTNNMAERDLRRLVLWRKKSYGTRSDRGRRFVERITTISEPNLPTLLKPQNSKCRKPLVQICSSRSARCDLLSGPASDEGMGPATAAGAGAGISLARADRGAEDNEKSVRAKGHSTSYGALSVGSDLSKSSCAQ